MRGKMGRYIKDVELNQPIDVVSMLMEDFLYHNHFTRADWNGEMVYYRKDGYDRERYIKWYYTDGVFHVEAWLKNPLGGEMDLDGVGGGASRKEFRENMDELIVRLQNQPADSLAGGHVGSDPLHHDSDYQKSHETWEKDTRWQQYYSEEPSQNTWKPTIEGRGALACAIVALLVGWWIPLLGIVFGVLALKKSEEYEQTRLIRVIAVIAIVAAVLRFFIYLICILVGVIGSYR